MVEFKQINKFKFFCSNAEQLTKEVLDVIEKLTGKDELDKYIMATNELLFMTILTRVVAREFFKQISELPGNLLTALVEVPYENETYTICLGRTPDVIDGKEKIVSSFYIK